MKSNERDNPGRQPNPRKVRKKWLEVRFLPFFAHFSWNRLASGCPKIVCFIWYLYVFQPNIIELIANTRNRIAVAGTRARPDKVCSNNCQLVCVGIFCFVIIGTKKCFPFSYSWFLFFFGGYTAVGRTFSASEISKGVPVFSGKCSSIANGRVDMPVIYTVPPNELTMGWGWNIDEEQSKRGLAFKKGNGVFFGSEWLIKGTLHNGIRGYCISTRVGLLIEHVCTIHRRGASLTWKPLARAVAKKNMVRRYSRIPNFPVFSEAFSTGGQHKNPGTAIFVRAACDFEKRW